MSKPLGCAGLWNVFEADKTFVKTSQLSCEDSTKECCQLSPQLRDLSICIVPLALGDGVEFPSMVMISGLWKHLESVGWC